MCGPKTKNIGLLNAKHIMFFFFAQGYLLIGKLKIYIIRQFFDASSPHGNFFEKKKSDILMGIVCTKIHASIHFRLVSRSCTDKLGQKYEQI